MAEQTNLLIKGDCASCGHGIQFFPEEGVAGSYKATCFLVAEAGPNPDVPVVQPDNCLANEAVTAAAPVTAAASAPKPATSTRSTSTTPAA